MTKKAKDIMSRGVVSVSPDTKLSDIARIMVEEGIHGVYVFDPTKKIAGVVEDNDIIKIFGKKLVEKTLAKEVMRKVDVKITPETTLDEVLKIMRDKKKRKLYVFYQESDLFPVGVISIRDIIREVDKEKAAIEMSRFLAQYEEFQEWLSKQEWKKS
ncbi:MAG: CBS domain-containing protein [Methanocellales archaeon]